jgi:hypothetical protein
MPKTKRALEMTGFTKEFSEEFSTSRLVIEDDGRVCYAYLASAEGITGDVWLYNRAPTPDEPEWSNRELAPFLNPVSLTRRDLPFSIPNSSEAFKVDWRKTKAGMAASIYIDGVLAGILAPGDKPGQSAAASADGPLANEIRK